MKRFLCVLLLSIFWSLGTVAQTASPCVAKYINLEFEQLETLKTNFYKIVSYYTKDGKYEPSNNLIYFMAMNYFLGNKLTWTQYAAMEKRFDAIPGIPEYMAPKLEVLIPEMWKNLEQSGKKYSPEVKAELDKKLSEFFPKINVLLPEVMGGNRILYRTLETDTQKIVSTEELQRLGIKTDDNTCVVLVEGCNTYYQMDITGYKKFSSLAEERAELKSRLAEKDVTNFLEYIRNQLLDSSEFKKSLKEFLSKNK